MSYYCCCSLLGPVNDSLPPFFCCSLMTMGKRMKKSRGMRGERRRRSRREKEGRQEGRQE